MPRRTLVFLLLLLWCAPVAAGDQPDRSLGISMQLVPQSAVLNSSRKPGFAVAPSPYLLREAEPPVLHNAEDFFSYVSKQSPLVRANGIWIVTNAPEAYTAQEKKLLQEIIGECAKRGIILYLCRFVDLPDGWKRS
jgi:hypothetical protein